MRILVTGSAGFIGFSLARRLISEGHFVIGFDGMTPYYDLRLKQKRHALLQQSDSFQPHIGMLEDKDALKRVVDDCQPQTIVHLAAQAGVRYSLENPEAYINANLVGTFNVLEAAREIGPEHLLLASTSSVYGGNERMPFAETDPTAAPMTLYAASKKACESMSHSYAHLWQIPTTCFRFFTVYGPWGRPDMALFKFVKAMEEDSPIDVYGEGEMHRDFTYIDDLVEAITRLMAQPPVQGKPVPGVADSLSPVAPWRVVNIGGGQPVSLMSFIETIEKTLGKTAVKNMLPMQKGDAPATFANAGLLKALTGFTPMVDVDEGVAEFVNWYKLEYAKL